MAPIPCTSSTKGKLSVLTSPARTTATHSRMRATRSATAVGEGVARGVGLGGGHDEGEAEQQGGGLHEPLGGAGARRRQPHHHAPDDGGGERGEVAHPLRLLDGHGEGGVGDQRGDQREPVPPSS